MDLINGGLINGGLVNGWAHATGYGDALRASVVVYYKLNGLTDSGPHGYTATNNNTVTFGAGKIGDDATFVRASNQWLTIGDKSELERTDDFTIAAWVNLASKPTDNLYIYCKDGFSSAGVKLLYQNFSGEDRFAIGYDTSFSTWLRADNLGSPSTGTWYFVLAWKSGSTTYLQVNNGTPDSGSIGAPAADSEPAVIGTFYTAGLGSLRPMDGMIGDLAYLDRALTDSAERSWWYDYGNAGNGLY